MSITVVEEKIKLLPEAYITLLNNYVDELLEKTQKIQSLKGSLSKNANVEGSQPVAPYLLQYMNALYHLNISHLHPALAAVCNLHTAPFAGLLQDLHF